jgi:hypothetical protein
MEIKLKGCPALLAGLALVAGFVGYRAFLHQDLEASPEVRQLLELHLSSEIAGAIVADTEAIRERLDQGDDGAASALAAGTVRRRVEIGDLAMKGTGDDILVRAHFTVHGPDAPESRTGYFRFSHSAITGWRYERETTALSWYLKVI